MPHVVSIAFKSSEMESKPSGRFARKAVERVVLAPKQGIVGDRKGSKGDRQLNVMFAETIDELKAEGLHAEPGELGEQIVLGGLPPEACVPGVHLTIGESAVIALGIFRTGCARFEHIQSRPRQSVAGRLGLMARVLIGGPIAVGDAVTVVERLESVHQQELF